MNKPYLAALILCTALSACGVREEDPEPGSVLAATSSVSTTTSTDSSSTTSSSTSTSTSSSSTGSSDDEVVENGKVVTLRFVDTYTGFWENESWPDAQATQILRIGFGTNKYHMQKFYDQSSGYDALLQNCFLQSSSNTQRTRSAKGLWHTYETTDRNGDPITSDDGWNLVGDKLEYRKYLGGELQASASSNYKRVYPGLAVNGLQICE